MQVLVINLSSENKRRKFQERQLAKLDLDFSILNATSIIDIDDKTYQKHYYDWQRPLRRSEVACYYSHRRCWEKVIDNNKPMLILEDDALLSKEVPLILSELESHNNIDLVDLEVTARKKIVSKTSKTLQSNNTLIKLYLNSSGAGGYILYPSGAKKLLQCEKDNGISLADAHIASCSCLNAYQIEPAPIVQFILCPYYQINNPAFIDFQTSSTNLEPKEKQQEIYFHARKLVNEAKLGIKKLKLLFISKRRLIFLNKDDFDDK